MHANSWKRWTILPNPMRLRAGRRNDFGSNMAEWVIEPLTSTHARAEFSCGKSALDTFLHSLVSQYEKRRLGRTYVATEPDSSRVAGYCTLASGNIDVSILPESERKKFPKHPLPTIHLGRLAVDVAYRGRRPRRNAAVLRPPCGPRYF